MLNLTCPNCGITADETDLHCDGQAHIARSGINANDDELENYLFISDMYLLTWVPGQQPHHN